jgi:hypothetical protein
MIPKRKAKPKIGFDTHKLYKRFSQIAGVPLFELYPVRGGEIGYNAGQYNSGAHIISAWPKHRFIWEHELRHGLWNLASPKERKSGKGQSSLKWIEPTNADPRENRIYEAMRNIFSAMGLKGLALAPVYCPAQVLRQTFVRRLISIHGIDGLLLLWIAPPKKIDALSIPLWRKIMVEKGYLAPKAGLTKKGLAYVRENLAASTIFQKLSEMEKYREKEWPWETSRHMFWTAQPIAFKTPIKNKKKD